MGTCELTKQLCLKTHIVTPLLGADMESRPHKTHLNLQKRVCDATNIVFRREAAHQQAAQDLAQLRHLQVCPACCQPCKQLLSLKRPRAQSI